jgi:hypothetical protein
MDDGQSTCAYIVQANECFHAHVSQAIGVHDKDLYNDGEITTMLISTTIATDDPITNVLIDHSCSSVISFCGTSLVRAVKGWLATLKKKNAQGTVAFAPC